MCYCCDKTTIISRKRLQRWFLVAFGFALPTQQPTGHRFCLTKLRTGNSFFVFENIFMVWPKWLNSDFFSGFKFEHIFQKIWITPAFFFSLYPTLCISLGSLCRLLTQTAGKYFFFKFTSIYKHLSNLENTNWNSSIFKDFEQLSQTLCYPGESERHKL